MRSANFLRTPIKAAHQASLANIKLSEAPFAADPTPPTTFPQTLSISFDNVAAAASVQITPLWEGALYFLADDPTALPAGVGAVTAASVASMNLVGDVILLSQGYDLAPAFTANVPGIAPAPSAVRYSKVKMTQEFLFTSMPLVTVATFRSNGVVVKRDDPDWHNKFIFEFLHGRAAVWCNLDATDPTKDFALNAMPIIVLPSVGSTATLNVTIASRTYDVTTPTWFTARPYDSIFGVPLVNAAIDTLVDLAFSPHHPSHSVISPLALYALATPTAFVPDDDQTKPLRTTFAAPRTDGKSYWQISVIRPPAPGVASSWEPQRPMPMHALAWQDRSSAAVDALRIPLTGRIYLPLANGTYDFWPIQRAQSPGTPASKLFFTQADTALKYLPLATSKVSKVLSATAGIPNSHSLYVSATEFDGKRVFAALMGLTNSKIQQLQDAASTEWNVEVWNLWIYRVASMEPYSIIYGHIVESAGRHGFAPEFLHAVVMGEGLGGSPGWLEAMHTSGIPYDPTQSIDSYAVLGLDQIAATKSGLVSGKYLDASFLSNIVDQLPGTNERGLVTHPADILGYETAIELIAAELHSRLDAMQAHLATLSMAATTEREKRFAAYVRYNTDLSSAQAIVGNLAANLTKWSGARPPDESNARYNTLRRLAISEWYEASGVYR
jgi:hypothetical protein